MAFSKSKEVVTRKEHKCAICGMKIYKGERVIRGVTTEKEFTNNIRAEYWHKSCC